MMMLMASLCFNKSPQTPGKSFVDDSASVPVSSQPQMTRPFPLPHVGVFPCRYDTYGRLTNITYPTGRVSSYRTDADSSVRIKAEGSNKEDITVTTNLSASGTFYTLMQGKCL